jgi:hypothetical protein
MAVTKIPIIGGPLDGGTKEVYLNGTLIQSFIGHKNNIYYRYTLDRERMVWRYDRSVKES